MDSPHDLGANGGMDSPVTGDPGLPGKSIGADFNIEVALAALLEPGVTPMGFAIIHNLKF